MGWRVAALKRGDADGDGVAAIDDAGSPRR